MSEVDAPTQDAQIRFGDQVIEQMPDDLYIPPDALSVFLDTFEGPLDLLLYLIRKTNVDILDIPIVEITNQYMDYVEVMKVVNLELAADYLVMAAILAEIKSRVLLPKPETEDDDADLDPRAELIRRLQEYERFKTAAVQLSELPQTGTDILLVHPIKPEVEHKPQPPEIDMQALLGSLLDVIKRADLHSSHDIQSEPLSVRERMTIILEKLQSAPLLSFSDCFDFAEGKMGVVVTFLAMLELLKSGILEVVQSKPFAPIYLKGTSDDSYH